MQFKILTEIPATADLVITPVWQDEKKRPYAELIRAEHFSGKAGEILYSILPHADTRRHVLLVGLGELKKATAINIAGALASAVKTAQDKKQTRAAIIVPEKLLQLAGARTAGEMCARLIKLTTYAFSSYITDVERHTAAMEQIIFIGVPAAKQKQFVQGVAAGEIIGAATTLARDLGNHPASDMHPEKLGAEAVAAARGISKLSVRVLGKKEIAKEKMGGLLGVNAGSIRPPAFIIMEYRGGKKADAPTVLVGKGITFDSGGISLKPGDKMDEMKFDMLGGATVIAAIIAAARLKLPVNVVALVPATENLPSGSAYRPGDILKTRGGKTIEVLNTDAEGRIVLADALSYAAKFSPKAIIDLATLTGACVYSLGENRAGMWSTDDKLAARLTGAAENSGELIWRMPLGEDYSAQVKSEIADVKNITERWGSANTAAAFLQEFVDVKTPWAHVDIAGVANSTKLQPARRVGASGWGVALLINLLRG